MSKGTTSRLILSYLQLTKPIISVSVALSALTGFVIWQGSFSHGWLTCLTGVFCLSGGAAAINHIQEKKTDRVMKRTSQRPVADGTISQNHALIFAVLLIIAGVWMLYQPDNSAPLLLGILNLFWYNVIYTPVKKITAFAAIPGAVVGAIPPVIGWTFAGGDIFHPHILILAFLFFVGQIPHFWLILLMHSGDYELARFPTLSKYFTQRQIANLTLVWVITTAMAAVLLVVFGLIRSAVFAMAVYALAFVLLISFVKWFNPIHLPDPRKGFLSLNIFYLLIMILLIADALTR
jgi:heme o synthase